MGILDFACMSSAFRSSKPASTNTRVKLSNPIYPSQVLIYAASSSLDIRLKLSVIITPSRLELDTRLYSLSSFISASSNFNIFSEGDVGLTTFPRPDDPSAVLLAVFYKSSADPPHRDGVAALLRRYCSGDCSGKFDIAPPPSSSNGKNHTITEHAWRLCSARARLRHIEANGSEQLAILVLICASHLSALGGSGCVI